MKTPGTFQLVVAVLFATIPGSPANALSFAGVETTALAAQPSAGPPAQPLSPHAQDIAELIGVKPQVERLLAFSRERALGASPAMEELALHQEVLEAVTAASLDVDSVLAEIASERSRLLEVRDYLSAKRDTAVNLANVGNLVTGTGLGIVVNALQFNDSTANIGNGIGVGSGIGSTLLSILGIRLQHGGMQSIGNVPNMLAVPFGRAPVLYSDYPDTVWQYLNRAPVGDAAGQTRLQQLMRDWIKVGRINAAESAKRPKQVDQLTTSMDSKRKIGIDMIANRNAMLNDVAGRVMLMKRDLAESMRAIRLQTQAPAR